MDKAKLTQTWIFAACDVVKLMGEEPDINNICEHLPERYNPQCREYYVGLWRKNRKLIKNETIEQLKTSLNTNTIKENNEELNHAGEIDYVRDKHYRNINALFSQGLKRKELAVRLKCSDPLILYKLERPGFPEWCRQRDPDGLGWHRVGKTYYPLIEDEEDLSIADKIYEMNNKIERIENYGNGNNITINIKTITATTKRQDQK